MIKRRTLSKIFGGRVWNTGGVIFSTGEAHASVKQLKMPWLVPAVSIIGVLPFRLIPFRLIPIRLIHY